MSKNVTNMFLVFHILTNMRMYQMDDVFFILNLENKKLKYINILAWFYAIFDVKIAWKREFWPFGPLWSTRVDHMCVIWPNTFWGLVSIYLKSLPPRYHVQKIKTHHGSKKTFFLSGTRWWNNHLHFLK